MKVGSRPRRAGRDSDDGESTRHLSGRRIVYIERASKSDLSDDQWDWMAKVNGYIARHCARVPGGDMAESRWRYPLMNRSHDPLKEGGCA